MQLIAQNLPPELEELDMGRGGGLTHDHMPALASALSDPKSKLAKLKLLTNSVGPEGAKHLTEALKSNSTLKALECAAPSRFVLSAPDTAFVPPFAVSGRPN